MAQQPALPRLTREGFVAARASRDARRRDMLAPKTTPRPESIPALPEHTLIWLAGELGPAERRAMREIVETAEVVREKDHVILVARVSAATMDSLASFETSREDLEDGTDHEPEESDESHDGREPSTDDEPDHDNEYDYLNAEPH